MVAGAREGTPADAVAGVVPRLVVEPATVAEAAEALAACARDRLRVAFAGGGTELELGAPPRGLDALLRTGRLDRVVEHAPSDQIAVVEAGVTLAALDRALAPHGQRLALDPPLPGRATLGGVVAAASCGPLRHRYGTPRDLVIGLGFVRADGTPAKGGGRVVKNVAGFDVPRLLVGSLGTLALVTTVNLRLHPRPEADATVEVAGLDGARAWALVAGLRAAQVELAAALALLERGGGDRLRLAVRLEGFAPGVAAQRERVLATAARLGAAAEPADPARAAALWARHEAVRTAPALRVRLSAPPPALPALAGAAAALARPLAGGEVALYPTLGLAFAGGEPADPARAARAVADARAALAAIGGAVVLTAAPAALRAGLDPWGPPPPSLALMRRVKDRLDPEHRLAPGRLVGGL